MQGRRHEMEDRHLCVHIEGGITLLGVFDGHGGIEASLYGSFYFHDVLVSVTSWREVLNCDGQKQALLLGDVLVEAFKIIDANMRISQSKHPSRSGSTAAICILTTTHIVCANAGDSRCVLGTIINGNASLANLEAVALSIDHKPDSPDERSRIVAAGALVMKSVDGSEPDRINGVLNVSRGLGDFDFKKNKNLEESQQMVSCVPDIQVHALTEKDFVLLIACDGLWDVMSNEEAVEKARAVFCTGESSMALIAEEMLDEAYDRGSTDNITCIVVKLAGASSSSSSVMLLGPEGSGGVMELRRLRGQDPGDGDEGEDDDAAARMLQETVVPAPFSMFADCDDDDD